jgi:hypothetical protein
MAGAVVFLKRLLSFRVRVLPSKFRRFSQPRFFVFLSIHLPRAVFPAANWRFFYAHPHATRIGSHS